MKGNDLANEVVPRDLLVFEGLLGLIPNEKVARAEAKFRAKGKWAKALACYETHEMLGRKVWDMAWRYSVEIDLITFLGRPFAFELEKRMENENMPFRRIWSEEPNILARRLATMPEVRTIYTPFPNQQLLFGSKGRYIQPGNAQYLFGSM